MRAIWDFNSKCNLNCLYCGAYHDIGKYASLSTDDVKKIVDNLSGTVDEIDLYGGEPLLSINLLDKLQYISDAGIMINITTNGQFSKNLLDKLAESKIKINNLVVSLDGFQQSHDALRGNGSHKKAYDLLKHAIYLRNEKHLSCFLGISSVISTVNIDEISSILDEWSKLEVDHITLLPVVEMGQASQNKWLFPDDEKWIQFYEMICAYIVSNTRPVLIHVDIPTPMLSSYLTLRFGIPDLIKFHSCEAVTESIYIDFAGNLRPCRESNDIICDLKSQSIKKCYNRFAPFLQKVDRHDYKMQCNCIFSENCNVCCFLQNRSKQMICIFAKKRIDEIPASQSFQLIDECCMYEDIDTDSFKVVYFNTMQHVSYSPEGYSLLCQIRERPLNCLTLEKITGIPREHVLLFMAQEISSRHVRLVA